MSDVKAEIINFSGVIGTEHCTHLRVIITINGIIFDMPLQLVVIDYERELRRALTMLVQSYGLLIISLVAEDEEQIPYSIDNFFKPLQRPYIHFNDGFQIPCTPSISSKSRIWGRNENRKFRFKVTLSLNNLLEQVLISDPFMITTTHRKYNDLIVPNSMLYPPFIFYSVKEEQPNQSFVTEPLSDRKTDLQVEYNDDRDEEIKTGMEMEKANQRNQYQVYKYSQYSLK